MLRGIVSCDRAEACAGAHIDPGSPAQLLPWPPHATAHLHLCALRAGQSRWTRLEGLTSLDRRDSLRRSAGAPQKCQLRPCRVLNLRKRRNADRPSICPTLPMPLRTCSCLLSMPATASAAAWPPGPAWTTGTACAVQPVHQRSEQLAKQSAASTPTSTPKPRSAHACPSANLFHRSLLLCALRCSCACSLLLRLLLCHQQHDASKLQPCQRYGCGCLPVLLTMFLDHHSSPRGLRLPTGLSC